MKTNMRYGKFFAACLLTAMSCFGIQLRAESDPFFSQGLLRTNWDVMEECLRQNPNIARTPDSETGIIPLAYIGDQIAAVNLAQWLITHGADVNAAGPNGMTPLQGANSPELVRFLLDHGAIVDPVTLRGAERLARRGNPRQAIIAPMLREAYDRQNQRAEPQRPVVVHMAQPVMVPQPGQLDRALGRRLQQLVNPTPPSALFSVGASF